MIAVDTNILVFAHRRDSPWHAGARDAISQLVIARTPWAIPWPCVHEFYCTVTRALYRPPSSPEQAVDQIEAWLASPTLSLLAEDLATWPVFRDLALHGRITAARTYDARIAACCLRHGVTELWTHDSDFSRFPALRVRNPLVDIQPTGAREPRAPWLTRATPARADRPRRRGRGAARRR